ncbi:MAG: SusD/RagB family nutrient-binding outer membrane lipoprotein [Tannerellaceae bacterium]|nr:SusD/RagB family nutrient-binding outer membrane lipoprotein [Tannerellaceae bacterium]
MKKIVTLIFLAAFCACTDQFEDFNEDKKNPAVVEGEPLFTSAQKSLTDQISSTNVNQNIFKLCAQYWTETTYTDEANYDLTTRNISANIFRYYYREPLKDLLEAEIRIKATEYPVEESPQVKVNKLHIIELLRAYAFQQLVDIFGAVPYTEALDVKNVYPAYDAGEAIYKDLIARVNAAVAGLDAGNESFGSADLIYGGETGRWIKFGNALKIKLGVSLADYDPALAEATVSAGVAGAFDSAADDALFAYLTASPNYNPIYADVIASGRHDFIPANTIVDIMNGLEDPRRAAYFTLYAGEYKGGAYGYGAPYGSHSHIPDAISAPDFKGILFTYAEVQFYLAEAAARGFRLPATAEAYYSEAVRASFEFWGAGGADAYLAKDEVKYSQAAWKERIGLQQWLAFYTRGLEGYTTWRRLDYPRLNIAELIREESEIPVRFTFPVNEQTLNKASYEAASQLIGGDLLTTKIFWDKY